MPATNLYCIVAQAQIVVRTSIFARVDHHETSRQHREYLKQVLKHMGMKPTPLAKAAGLAASTLTRVLDENGTETFSARTISSRNAAAY
jgi:predicted transcriptional regulator